MWYVEIDMWLRGGADREFYQMGNFVSVAYVPIY